MRRMLVHSGRGWRDGFFPLHLDDPEYLRRFGTEEACRDFLFRSKWPDGFTCARCGPAPVRWLDERKLQCVRCGKKASLTGGTILQGTRKPLTLWFQAAFLVVQRGANARLLQEELKLTYKVAWTWAHKLRAVMRVKRTLDEPSKPFPAAQYEKDGRRNEPARRRWFAAHGNFAWRAERPGGSPGGKCCARLEAKDLDGPLGMGELLETARELLARTYSWHVSEKHLRAYLDETAFRLNHRELAARDVGRELAGRFAGVRPQSYRTICGPRPQREALFFDGVRRAG